MSRATVTKKRMDGIIFVMFILRLNAQKSLLKHRWKKHMPKQPHLWQEEYSLRIQLLILNLLLRDIGIFLNVYMSKEKLIPCF